MGRKTCYSAIHGREVWSGNKIVERGKGEYLGKRNSDKGISMCMGPDGEGSLLQDFKDWSGHRNSLGEEVPGALCSRDPVPST